MKIHNVFYVSLLKLYDRVHKSNIPPLLPINIEGKNKYKVKEILDSRSYYGRLSYFVKWMSYPHSENQWLSENNIAELKDLVDLFHILYPKKLTEGKERKAAKNNH